jgi:hypothetical protein
MLAAVFRCAIGTDRTFTIHAAHRGRKTCRCQPCCRNERARRPKSGRRALRSGSSAVLPFVLRS